MKVTNQNEYRSVWYFANNDKGWYPLGTSMLSSGYQAYIQFVTTTQRWDFPTGFEIDLGRWQHLIATWSEQEGAQVYINGLQEGVGSVDTKSSAPNDNREFVIGDDDPRQLTTIDDFLVYYRHVNEEEAKELFLNRYFDDNQNGVTHYDTPPFDLANDAALPRTTQGVYGNMAISFNGVDDSLSLGNLRTSCFGNLDYCDDGITYSLWLKVGNEVTKDPSQTVYYLSSGAQSRWSMGVALFSRQGMMSWSFKTSTQWWRKEGQFTVTYDTWQHMAATWSPSRGVVVYRDNQRVKAFSFAMNMGNNGRHNDFVLGRPNHLKEDGQWNGEFVIDELKAFYFFISDPCVMDLTWPAMR